MFRADKQNIIDLVVTTINIISPNDALIVAGNGLFQEDVVIDGDLTVLGTINGAVGGGTSGSSIASNVISLPALPNITATNVQDAINQLSTLSHTQNTDTILDNGGTNEISALEINQHIKQYLELSDTAGGLTLTSIETDIPFNSQPHINSNYSHTLTNPNVIFNVSGTYKIIYKATTAITSGVLRTNIEFKLQIDTGGGYTDVVGSQANTTNRTTGSGPSTVHSTNYITVSTGDELKLVGKQLVGTSTVKTVANQTNLVIERMD